jgi:hypothetical protein
MWIFTTAGFVSAVQHRANHDNVMVRARDKAALDNMLTSIELAGKALAEDGSDITVDQDLTIVTAGNGDYRHRVTMSKSTFALFLQFEVLNYLSYPNFKSELAKYRGPEYTSAAHSVWSAMQKVSDGPQVYNSVGEGGKSLRPKYTGGKGGFVGSTFFDGEDRGGKADWGTGYHSFNGSEDEADLTEPMYSDQFADAEAEAEFGVLPEGSEDWTDAQWEGYLASIAPLHDEVTAQNFLEPTAQPKVDEVAKPTAPIANSVTPAKAAAAAKVAKKAAAAAPAEKK